MRASVDGLGRIVVPKQLREALGLRAGTAVDISHYGAGLQIVPIGRTARLEPVGDGAVVAVSDTPIDDEVVFGLIDSGRR